MKTFKNIMKKISVYLKTNVLITAFFISGLINATIVRCFTVANYFAIKPILADIVVLLLIASIAYFFKPKNQFKYLFIWSIIFTLVCVINSVYYTNYISFASFSLLETSKELGGYTDAVFENILELKDLIFIWQPITLIFLHMALKKKKYYQMVSKIENGKIRFLNTMIVSIIILGFFISMLTSTDISRLNKQWNRNSVVMEFGIYTYQFNDLVTSVRTKVNSMFGFDEAYKEFREYYENRENVDKKNKYTNIFEGKNVLVIHAESIQGFTMNLKFNDLEVTPNLNKLVNEGIYFSNFYAEESVGNSSDSEFTFATSLMPSSNGTVFMNYFDRNYVTIQKLLSEKGYYTFSMHANNGSAWNRNVMHENLGYDNFYYYTKDYQIDEEIGLGLSDKSFFRQSSEIISGIDLEHDKWYGLLIMLTNHTPFSDIEGHTDYSLTFTYNKLNEETGEYEEFVDDSLEGTKLGNYLKSVHYADSAIGELLADLETRGLLDDTVVVIYGDHDAKLKQSELNKLFEHENYLNLLIEPEDHMTQLDDFTYEINRKVPLIIWTNDLSNKYKKNIDMVMGMIDVMPTLGNMLNINNDYALGNDIFSIDENVVVFPSGNFITNKIYYNSSTEEYRQLDLTTNISIDYINNYIEYADQIIKISNDIISYDLIEQYEKDKESLNILQ